MEYTAILKELLSNHIGNLKGWCSLYFLTEAQFWGKSRATRNLQFWWHNSSIHLDMWYFVLLLEWDFRKHKFSSCVYIEKNLLFVWICFDPRLDLEKVKTLTVVLLFTEELCYIMGFVRCFIVFCVDINKHGNLNDEPEMGDNFFYLLDTKPSSWVSGSLCDLLWPPCCSQSGAKEKSRKRQPQNARDSRKWTVICCMVIIPTLRSLLKQTWTLPHILWKQGQCFGSNCGSHPKIHVLKS